MSFLQRTPNFTQVQNHQYPPYYYHQQRALLLTHPQQPLPSPHPNLPTQPHLRLPRRIIPRTPHPHLDTLGNLPLELPRRKVQHDNPIPPFLTRPQIRKHIFIPLIQKFEIPVHEDGLVFLAVGEPPLPEAEDGELGLATLAVEAGELGFRVDGDVVFVDAHPRLDPLGAEARVGAAGPLHGRARVVAGFLLQHAHGFGFLAAGEHLFVVVYGFDVFVFGGGDAGGEVDHAEFFALVDVEGAREGGLQEAEEFGAEVAGGGGVGGVAGDGAGVVVVFAEDAA